MFSASTGRPRTQLNSQGPNSGIGRDEAQDSEAQRERDRVAARRVDEVERLRGGGLAPTPIRGAEVPKVLAVEVEGVLLLRGARAAREAAVKGVGRVVL